MAVSASVLILSVFRRGSSMRTRLQTANGAGADAVKQLESPGWALSNSN
ncbi:Uncharacterized protein EbC_pEb17200100 (plasmid) [Erwinia billingiae Eb661]|uniref:Uncharacterized protein n=1 Tax=Erwinia billingiae (strain Eb661) TaxID=634500 RepID=D8MJL5_ERWBE|nr:Uncharacterized protein EbC_pEb17200100 [Erwinia billingiae Eb661]